MSLGCGPRLQQQHSIAQFYQTRYDVAYERLAKQRNLILLESLFNEADADGSGEMSLDEFRKALQNRQIQEAFSRLGVQPHQSELVFRSLDKTSRGELTIGEFMGGLTELVGDFDNGTELNIDLLRPGNRDRKKTEGSPAHEPRAVSLQELAAGDTMLPRVQVQRAFVQRASAQALHPATALKRRAQHVS